MLIGIQRAGFVAFPISPRNSPAAVAHLLSKTGSEYLVVGPESSVQELSTAAFQLMEESNTPLPQKTDMPIFEDLYVDDSAEAFEPLPPLNADLDDPIVMMHSSGTSAQHDLRRSS